MSLGQLRQYDCIKVVSVAENSFSTYLRSELNPGMWFECQGEQQRLVSEAQVILAIKNRKI